MLAIVQCHRRSTRLVHRGRARQSAGTTFGEKDWFWEQDQRRIDGKNLVLTEQYIAQRTSHRRPFERTYRRTGLQSNREAEPLGTLDIVHKDRRFYLSFVWRGHRLPRFASAASGGQGAQQARVAVL